MDYTKVRRKHGLHRREKKAWTTQKREESMDYTEERRKYGLHRREKKGWTTCTEQRRKHGLQKREEKVQQYNSIIMM